MQIEFAMLTYFSGKHDWSSSQNALRRMSALFHPRSQKMFALLNFHLLHIPIYRLTSVLEHRGIMQVILKMRREDKIYSWM